MRVLIAVFAGAFVIAQADLASANYHLDPGFKSPAMTADVGSESAIVLAQSSTTRSNIKRPSKGTGNLKTFEDLMPSHENKVKKQGAKQSRAK